jgi:hypothetical protein
MDGMTAAEELERLLGAPYRDLLQPRYAYILKLLLGPHGYAIYKMLKARSCPQHIEARVNAVDSLIKLGLLESKQADNSNYDFLAKLLNYKNFEEMMLKFTDNDAYKLNLLSKPHGYVICKMLLARLNA